MKPSPPPPLQLGHEISRYVFIMHLNPITKDYKTKTGEELDFCSNEILRKESTNFISFEIDANYYVSLKQFNKDWSFPYFKEFILSFFGDI